MFTDWAMEELPNNNMQMGNTFPELWLAGEVIQNWCEAAGSDVVMASTWSFKYSSINIYCTFVN